MNETKEPIIPRIDNIEDDVKNLNSDIFINKPPESKITFEDVTLSKEQQYALDSIVEGFSVFITGGSGSGKSSMIKHIVRKLESMGEKVAVTSANLSGAIQIGGKTIQSFSGINKFDDEWDIIKKKGSLSYVKKIWSEVGTIIIDDISMLNPQEFRKLVALAQYARQVKNPLQWVLIGDFLSIPPIGTKYHSDKSKDQTDFCFQIEEWTKIIHRVIFLSENKRQLLSDPEGSLFTSILEDIRIGSENHVNNVKKLHECLNREFEEKKPFTKLFSKLEYVTAENETNLRKLSGQEFVFNSQKGYQIGNKVCPLSVPKTRPYLVKDVLEVIKKLSINEQMRSKLLQFLERNALVESCITLKLGCYVILMANLNYEKRLIKGSQGIVVGFTHQQPHYPIVQFETCRCIIKSFMWTVDYSKETKLWYAQIPLKLGWAYSIHRLRGMTFDRVEVNMKDLYDYGQVYEVFSKVSTLSGIRLTNIHWAALKTHPEAVNYYKVNIDKWKLDFQQWNKKSLTKNIGVVPFIPVNHIPISDLRMEPTTTAKDLEMAGSSSLKRLVKKSSIPDNFGDLTITKTVQKDKSGLNKRNREEQEDKEEPVGKKPNNNISSGSKNSNSSSGLNKRKAPPKEPHKTQRIEQSASKVSKRHKTRNIFVDDQAEADDGSEEEEEEEDYEDEENGEENEEGEDEEDKRIVIENENDEDQNEENQDENQDEDQNEENQEENQDEDQNEENQDEDQYHNREDINVNSASH